GDMRNQTDLVDVAAAAYAAAAAAALPDKTGSARAITTAELAALSQRPGGVAAVSREQLAAAFLDLPADRQRFVLDYQWRTVAGSAMLPALRRLVDEPPTYPPSVRDLALLRLSQLAPDEARPAILREIRNPQRGASLRTL